MTIKKKTSVPKPPDLDRSVGQSEVEHGRLGDFVPEHPFSSLQAQAVPGSSGGNGWVSSGSLSVPSASGVPSGWNSPGGSLSPRWSQSGSGSSRDSEKRPAHVSSPQSGYDFEEEYGPSTSKRRHRGFSGHSRRHGKRDFRGVANSTSNITTRPPLTPSPPVQQDGGAAGCDGGYNSEDEYSHLGVTLTEEEWVEKDRRFERHMKKKGFVIKKMKEDGSCLFRAVADQVYGDEEMHDSVRDICMNYIEANSEHFAMYITESIEEYVARKRYPGVHGNHLEIQAMSELYSRPIHIYCYSAEPINIFQAVSSTNDSKPNPPIRLCYHRGVHYNSLIDPHKATIGVGLGLPGLQPGLADRNLLNQAVRASEDGLVEKAMLEDKIKATDWEATNEVIEEQVARESYLQWLRDNERRNPGQQRSATSSSATVTSGELRSPKARHTSGSTANASPKGHASPKASCSKASSCSPKAGCSRQDSPKPGSSSSQNNAVKSKDYGLGPGFQLLETASFLNGLPPNMFGLDDWTDTGVLTQVLAASQQEYLDSLKKQQQNNSDNGPPVEKKPDQIDN